MKSHGKKPEVVSLNGDWGDFDPSRVSLEELEQRFELSVALPAILEQCGGNCNGCTNLQVCCGSF